MLHFYDGQIRRYLTQSIRLMSNFSYKDGDGDFIQIPVTYGDLSRQVANIIKDNSENKIPSAPRIAIHIIDLQQDRSKTSDSTYVSKVHVRERALNADGTEYLNEQGKNYTVERLMPTPYILGLNVDIWSTSTDQKLQILEQILTLFNPSLEIQSTDNYIDWTSLTSVNLETINFSSRNVPVGIDTEIDIATLKLTTPIYLSPPAKVKRLGVITKVIASIYNEESGDIDLGISTPILQSYQDVKHPVEQVTTKTESATGEVGIESNLNIDLSNVNRSTISTTYQNYGLYITGTKGELVVNDIVGNESWEMILQSYPGEYAAGVSQIRVRQLDTTNYLIGTFTLNPLNDKEISIIWDSDTLPANTIINSAYRNSNSLTSIDYIIEPERWNPSTYKVSGLRVLILSSINDSTNASNASYDGPDAWKNNNGTDVVAGANDIIEWNGTSWVVIFDASSTSNITYMKNLNTNIQYKWNGKSWSKSWEGFYSGGNWMAYLDG